ncbi:MAG: bifunctional 4-hydroxy-2-oxoglutarate aldolase/2-dehydro-3-deoxy-phosphogluconate aldolase [Chloroflexi bacterium]|nr:bifunctional 4-hydroxy-2-oxoglutarate aldolase/2-dehydro-3-deoxy-phosphogluconate aldolase [Chloroflexota bacterium]
MDDAAGLGQVARAIKEGGVDVIEFTMTTPGALKTIEQCITEFGTSVLLGAGTVLDPETARAAILAGARFLVSPTFNSAVITMAHRYDVAILPGTFTPTEMLTAWEAGADLLKVFPAAAVGPQYFKDVLAPLPFLQLVPTGGVSLENTADFIRAGAVAVAVGSALVDKRAIVEGRFDLLAEKAHQLMIAVREGRGL